MNISIIEVLKRMKTMERYEKLIQEHIDRRRKGSRVVCIKLSNPVLEELDLISKQLNVNRSDIIRYAIIKFLKEYYKELGGEDDEREI